jgi:hypothetical protein
MKKLLATTVVFFFFMVSSKLVAQSSEILYESVFKKNTLQNEEMFFSIGFKVDSYRFYDKKTIITFEKKDITDEHLSIIQCEVHYKDGENLPFFVRYTSNDKYIYESLLQNCKDKKMRKYFNEEDQSAQYDMSYSSLDFAFGFTSKFSDSFTVYSVDIIK